MFLGFMITENTSYSAIRPKYQALPPRNVHTLNSLNGTVKPWPIEPQTPKPVLLHESACILIQVKSAGAERL